MGRKGRGTGGGFFVRPGAVIGQWVDRLLPLAVMLPLLLVLSPVLLVFGGALLMGRMFDYLALVNHRAVGQPQAILVSSGRHGWREFTQNDVAPVLPPSVVLHVVGEELPPGRVYRAALRRAGVPKRPYVVTLRHTPVVVSLNTLLGPLKAHATRRSPEVQQQVRAVLEGALRDLPG